MALELQLPKYRIEIDSDGMVGLRVIKQAIDTVTGNVMDLGYHRTTINPLVPANLDAVNEKGAEPVFTSIADQFTAMDEHLQTMGFPSMGADVIAKAEAFSAVMAAPEGAELALSPAKAIKG